MLNIARESCLRKYDTIKSAGATGENGSEGEIVEIVDVANKRKNALARHRQIKGGSFVSLFFFV